MKRALCALSFVATMTLSVSGWGQQYFTREGKISFFSETPIENIEAHNAKATSVWDAGSGQLEFAVLVKAFQFEKALMQEHFNENYMESDQFPKAVFKGKLADAGKVDPMKDGKYAVTVVGDLTLHGVTKPVETQGVFSVKNGVVEAKATFEIDPEDYGIAIPAVVRENIAKQIRIEVDAQYQLLKK